MPKPKLTPEDLDRILAGEDVWGDQVWVVKDWNTPEPDPTPPMTTVPDKTTTVPDKK